MKNQTRTCLMMITLLIGTALLAAEYGGPTPDLSWHTIDGGGGVSYGGTLSMIGGIGQPDAGTLTGGTLEMRGGFFAAFDSVAAAPCPADTNGDLMVNVTDLLAVLAAWGPNPGHPADVNGDNQVDVVDLLAVLGNWGLCP